MQEEQKNLQNHQHFFQKYDTIEASAKKVRYFMKHTLSQGRLLYLLMAVLPYGLYALSSPGLSYLYTVCASDVILGATVLPIVLDCIIAILQIAIIPAVTWSLICIAGFSQRNSSQMLRLFFLYLGSLLFGRLTELGTNLWLNGSLNVATDLLYAVWYLALEGILAVVLFFLIRRRVLSYTHAERAKLNALRFQAPKESVERAPTPLYPFQKFYRRDNPLLHTLLTLAILLAAVRVGQRILYDIVYCIDAASLPAWSELPVMIAYYLGDLLLGLGFYALSVWLCRTLLRQ